MGTTKKNLLLIGVLVLTCAEFFYLKAFSDELYGPPNLSNGETVYINNCAACHGDKGLGDGVASASLTIKPDNIHQELRDLFSFKAELINSVLDGDNGQGGVMPSFRESLSPEQINDVFGYILHINKS